MQTGLNHAVRVTVAALSIVLGLVSAVPAAAQCPADLTGNGFVDGGDLGPLLAAWGTSGGEFGGDLTADGVVNGADLAFVIAGWGPCSQPMVPEWATLVEAQPDPSVVTSPTLRAAISATGLAWRVKDTRTQIEMVLIPPGSFTMGCSGSQLNGCSSDELPTHQVALTQPFYLGRYEVTQAQWTSEMGWNPSWWTSGSPAVPQTQVPNRPVESVWWTWTQDFAFQTGMRLPTEAEWEYAYRAGTATAFHGFTNYLNGTNSDGLLPQIAWSSANSSNQPRPVGGRASNGLGLHDMAGNVAEWVQDLFGGYTSVAQTDPAGPSTGSNRVVRGGSYVSSSGSCRASTRFYVSPTASYQDLGFRVARSP